MLWIDLLQDKFLQKSIEVHLEQTEIAARSDRRTIMVAELAVGEIVLGGDSEPRLVQCIQPRVRVRRRDSQGAIGERLRAAIELLQVRLDSFSSGSKEPAQFGFDVNFPFCANFLFARGRRRAEDALPRGLDSLDITALRDLPE